jgi:acetolactate synthase-1/2/3 large subunit
MDVYEAVLDQLIGSGVRYFAGMVGSTSAPYVGGLAQRNDARYIAVRHEQVAAAMIDATARLSGRPGCVMVHGGSGLMAASLGIASAALDATPMIVLSATQERRAMEGGWWQTMDVLAPVRDLVKWQIRVERPDQAVGAIARALRESVTGRPGVAQVDLPIDVSTAPLGDDAIPVPEPRVAPLLRPWPDPDSVRRTVDLLAKAARPVLLIGGGANYAGAGAELIALAERLHMPVVNTATSRAVVPETHPLVLGPSGILGYASIGDAILESDLILAIGSRLSDLQLSRTELLPTGAPIVQVDIDGASVSSDPAPTLGIVADARAFTQALNRALDDAGLAVPDARRKWAGSLATRHADWRAAWIAAAPDNGLVQPQEVVAALAALPAETIFTHGAGDHGFYGSMVPVVSPGAHLMSARLGAMGCALGMALGAKLERPAQTVIGCVGDGDLMLQIGDLETMSREGLAVVVIVFNNFRLGSQRQRVAAYGPVIGVDHGNPDFAKLAELFGCRGYRVDRPGQFAAALRDAVAANGPCVIDIIVDPEARPPRTEISLQAR